MAFDKIAAFWNKFPTYTPDDTANAADPNGSVGQSYGGFPAVWKGDAVGMYKQRLQAPFRQKWCRTSDELQRTVGNSWIGAPSMAYSYPVNQQAAASAYLGLYYRCVYKNTWSTGLLNITGNGSSGTNKNATPPNTLLTAEFEANINFWMEPAQTANTNIWFVIAMTAFDTRAPNAASIWKHPFATDTGHVLIDEAHVRHTQNNAIQDRQTIRLFGSLPGQLYENATYPRFAEVKLWVAQAWGAADSTAKQPGYRMYDVQGSTTLSPEPIVRST